MGETYKDARETGSSTRWLTDVGNANTESHRGESCDFEAVDKTPWYSGIEKRDQDSLISEHLNWDYEGLKTHGPSFRGHHLNPQTSRGTLGKEDSKKDAKTHLI